MLVRAVGNLLVLAVVLATTPSIHAAQYLLVSRTSAGAWSFQEAQSLSVNGKDKLRGTPLASGTAATWDSKAIGRLAEVQLSNFRVVRRTPDGSMLARTSDSAGWQLLLPEGTNSKTADPAATLWSGSTVTFKKDQKDKSPSVVQMDELYAIVPGADAAASAALIATDVSAHQVPGMREADAFRQMLSLLPEAVKAFPAASAAKTVHDYLDSNLSARLKKWQDGDVPVDVLDESIELAKAAGAAFPADAGLSALSTQARSVRAALDRRVAILRALDAGKQSDAFLAAYRDFEIYDKSYPDLAQAHAAHLKTSAVEHVPRGSGAPAQRRLSGRHPQSSHRQMARSEAQGCRRSAGAGAAGSCQIIRAKVRGNPPWNRSPVSRPGATAAQTAAG